MKILLVNDDGIHAKGLRKLAKALAEQNYEIYVVAPESQRSGYSHFMTFRQPIFCREEEVEGAKLAYSISGTPADCAKFAIVKLHIEPDLVISGPNEGANYGSDVIYSGTVSAAQEACLMGYKAVALSCRSLHKVHDPDLFEFDGCIAFALKYLDKLASYDVPYTMLNINMPDVPFEQLKGIRVARMGIHRFNDRYDEKDFGNGILGYSLDGEPKPLAEDQFESDVHAVHEGFVAVTPIACDYTNYNEMRNVEDLLK